MRPRHARAAAASERIQYQRRSRASSQGPSARRRRANNHRPSGHPRATARDCADALRRPRPSEVAGDPEGVRAAAPREGREVAGHGAERWASSLTPLRVAVVNACSPAFSRRVVRPGPASPTARTTRPLRSLMERRFGTSDAYSHELRRLGHEAADFVVNAPELQRAWRRGNGLGRSWLPQLPGRAGAAGQPPLPAQDGEGADRALRPGDRLRPGHLVLLAPRARCDARGRTPRRLADRQRAARAGHPARLRPHHHVVPALRRALPGA